VSPPSAYEQVTYNVEEAEDEDWEIDVKFYECTVFLLNWKQ